VKGYLRTSRFFYVFGCDRCLGDWVLSLSLASGGRQRMRGSYRRRVETIFIVKSYFSSVFVGSIRDV